MIYPLIGIEGENGTKVISRGRDYGDVLIHCINEFPTGTRVWEMTALPINANKLYDKNHDSDWLYRMPDYLKRKLK